MSTFLKRNAVLVAVIAMIAVMCVSLVCLTVSQNVQAEAASEFTESGDTISIGHITDTHYYALRLCYTYGDAIETDDIDYFYNWVMNKSTKMWLESATSFENSLKTLETKMPDYVVLSGDCVQDGELVNHIDVANKLRKLQNEVRKTKPNFQVFVIMGNHDLYNPDTFRFDNTGYKESTYYATRLEIAKVYAGLGYPNMTEDEASEFYAPLKDIDGGKLMPDGYDYVRSDLSSDFDYAWEFVKDGADGKAEVFSFGDNDGEYAADDITMAKLIDSDKVELVDNSTFFRSSGLCYTYEKFNKYGMDIETGALTGIQVRKDNKFTFITGDVVMSNAVDGHVLGGQLQQHTQDWLTANKDFAKPADDTTLAMTAHHSIVEHWGMEEEITTGFIVYNPIETADFIANYGVRYVYTGHQHANDKASYVSDKGNQLIDMEGAANVSVGSQCKITTIKRGTLDGKFAEQTYLSAFPNIEVDATDVYDKVFANDKYGYVAKNKVAKYIDDSKKTIKNYSDYAQTRVYDNIVENYINKFLKKDITEKLGEIVKGIPTIEASFLKINLGDYAGDVVQLADNLISEINTKILKDYTYGGDNERFKAADMKAFGYLEELAYRVLDYDLSGEGDKVFTVFMDCYMRHSTGKDWNSYDEMKAEKPSYVKAFNNLITGDFVTELIKILLDENNGLMFLVKGLSETTIDLSKDISEGFSSLIEAAFIVLGIKDEAGNDLTLETFNLGKIAKALGGISAVTDLIDNLGVQIDLANLTIPEIIDDIVDKYLTDNFKQGLGEYAYNILYAFGIDGGHQDVIDDKNGEGYLMEIAEYKGEGVTYRAVERKEIVTIENGKLPSMLTNNFGDDVATTRNFTYYTDRRIKDGAIQYTTDVENHTGATTKTATTKVYATTKPLIDLGIWCQSGYVELARHTVELTGLKAGTTYAYRAGSAVNNYWSDWYTFTTAPEDGKFEVMIASDLQSSTQTAYERIAKIQKDAVEKVFTNGVSFVINPGDIVDNGRNLSQYRWLYDSDQSFNASYASVVAAGNHDNKYFTVDKASNMAAYGGASDGAYTADHNYMWTHYNYGISSSQVDNTGFYYSFDYGKVHFTVLNTNDIESIKNKTTNADGKEETVTTKQLGKKQYEWLVNDLTDTDKEWKVIVMHKSLYSEGSHSFDKDVVGMRTQLTPLFAEKGVNLVIAGHDHVYNETFYLDANGQKVSTDANGKNEIGKKGTLYLTVGTMGEKFYNFVDNPNVPTATGTSLHKAGHLSDPTFGKLAFDGEKLYYYGYQYLREYNSEGKLTGGEVKAIEKVVEKTDKELTGIIVVAVIAGVVVISVAVVIIIIAVTKKKTKSTSISR